jgi:type IV pilus assembly protein PilY1
MKQEYMDVLDKQSSQHGGANLKYKNYRLNRNWLVNPIGITRLRMVFTLKILLVSPILYSAAIDLDQTRPYGSIGSPAVYPANLAVNGGKLYASRFDADQYTGDVIARSISKAGLILQDVFDDRDLVTTDNSLWRAHEQLPDHDSRVIFTSRTADGSTEGYEFQWDLLHTDLQLELGFADEFVSLGIDLLNWVRGDAENEGTEVDNLRERISLNHKGDAVHYVLGDMTHSSVQYVGPPFKFIDDEEYTAFRIANKDRVPMLYIGGNDGMLHGIRASDGVEQFAYIPQAVLPNLQYLGSQSYKQSYYVDGTPTIRDAYGGFSDCSIDRPRCWRTILVGGLGAGGQSVYALDVTNPGPVPLNETTAKDMVLWAFTDDDLGYTFSRPEITRLSDGTWVTIFGSGVHDVGASKAALFVIDIVDGELIQKIELTPPTITAPNGLFSPAVSDADYDGDVDYVYAGDTEGNLWKFDLSTMTGEANGGDNPAFVAFSDGDGHYPLVKVTGIDDYNNSTTLLIQTRPIISTLANGTTIVIFGTGRLFSKEDAITNYGDGLFGIFDNANTETGHGVYYPAAATSGGNFTLNTFSLITVPGSNARKLSTVSEPANPIGWRIALDPGERIITQLNLRNKRITFTTVTPTADDDFTDNDNWLNGVNYATGGTPAEQFLDVDQDGDIDSGDLAGGAIPVSAFLGHGVASGPRAAQVESGLDINLVTHGRSRTGSDSQLNGLSTGVIPSIPDPDPNPDPPDPGPGEGGTEYSASGKTITTGNVEDAIPVSSRRVSWREVFSD